MSFSRTAIISDIHGNLNALVAVFEDIARNNCDRTICLGDVVDGGPSDAAAVRFLMDHGITTVRGNHDECAELPSTSPEMQFLNSLPPELIEGDIIFTHITPRATERKIRDQYEAWNVFEETPHRLAFVGHTHIPAIYRYEPNVAGAAAIVPFQYATPIAINPSHRYIVCVGAVGYGRDGIAAARYAILDSARSALEVRRVDAPMLDL
jgi:predicted phosphodiesterase